jgi:Tfp pilus assembly protein PilO
MKARAPSLITALLIFGLLVGGWFGFIAPKVSATNETRDQTQAAQESTGSLQVQLAMLRQQVAGMHAQQQRLRTFEQRIPGTMALPALIRKLAALARHSQVDLINLTSAAPPTPSASAIPLPTTPDTGGTPPPTSTPAPTVPPSATLPPSTAHPATPAPTGAAARYRVIPITMIVTGTYFLIENFITAIETMTRPMVLTSVALAPTNTATAASAPTRAPLLRAVLKGSAFTSTSRLPADSSPPPPPLPTPTPVAPALNHTPTSTAPATGGTSPSGAAALEPPGRRIPSTPSPSATRTAADRSR